MRFGCQRSCMWLLARSGNPTRSFFFSVRKTHLRRFIDDAERGHDVPRLEWIESGAARHRRRCERVVAIRVCES